MALNGVTCRGVAAGGYHTAAITGTQFTVRKCDQAVQFLLLLLHQILAKCSAGDVINMASVQSLGAQQWRMIMVLLLLVGGW